MSVVKRSTANDGSILELTQHVDGSFHMEDSGIRTTNDIQIRYTRYSMPCGLNWSAAVEFYRTYQADCLELDGIRYTEKKTLGNDHTRLVSMPSFP